MRKEYDFSKTRRNPLSVAAAKGKTRITIRLDNDILDWFRNKVNESGGGNYQSLINQALRRSMTTAAEPLEAVVRRMVREELRTPKPRLKKP